MDSKERLLELLTTEKTEEEHLLCRVAFHAILGGEPAAQIGLAEATGFPGEKVDSLLRVLSGRGLVVVEADSGRVIGSWGLSSAPTDHVLLIRGRELYTWCAVDAIGIPAGLREDAQVVSRCYRCGTAIRIEMIGGEVASAEPEAAHVWVTGGQAGRSVVGFT